MRCAMRAGKRAPAVRARRSSAGARAANSHLHCTRRRLTSASPPHNLERVFEKGFSTKSRDTNYGIGLHWCANAISALGGRIWAASDGPGRGASMHLSCRSTAGRPGRHLTHRRGLFTCQTTKHCPFVSSSPTTRPAIRDAYREILIGADMSGETAVFRNLRERLFTKSATDQVRAALRAAIPASPRFSASEPRPRSQAVRGALAARPALRGRLSRHAHAAGPRWDLGGHAHPRIDPADRDRDLHGVFGRRSGDIGAWCRRRTNCPICRSRSTRTRSVR